MPNWVDDEKLDKYIIRPLIIISIILLGIAVQFQESTAISYVWIGFFALLGYIGSRTRALQGSMVWAGFGRERDFVRNLGIGVGLYILLTIFGFVVTVPLAIGTSQVLNALYRWIAAFFLEEACFRSFLYPSFKAWFGGNALGGAVLSSIAWSYFHLVVLGGNTGLVLGVMVIGIALAMINEYAKSSIPSYVAHCLWNGQKVLLAQ